LLELLIGVFIFSLSLPVSFSLSTDSFSSLFSSGSRGDWNEWNFPCCWYMGSFSHLLTEIMKATALLSGSFCPSWKLATNIFHHINRSVGCTIIELMTGEPPYSNLAPLSAMFRIVQQDHPPFPEGISQALEEFLFECFKRDPKIRADGAKLQKHKWIIVNTQVLFTFLFFSRNLSLTSKEREKRKLKSARERES